MNKHSVSFGQDVDLKRDIVEPELDRLIMTNRKFFVILQRSTTWKGNQLKLFYPNLYTTGVGGALIRARGATCKTPSPSMSWVLRHELQ